MKKMGWRIIPVFLFMLLCFFLWRGLSLDPHHLPSAQIGKSLPEFSLKQLENPKVYFTNKDIHQVALVNVWASWCEACVEEQAFMMQLARAGVPIFGINYKDKPDEALRWLSQWGNPYQLIGQDQEGRVAIDLGVYGAPETFVVDKKGIIRYRHVGIMDQNVWMTTIVPLMKELEQSS